MSKKKGSPKTGGRKAGTPNKITKSVRETFQSVFEELQQDPEANLLEFAKKQPVEFYRLSTKLIPTDIKAELGGTNGETAKFEITLKL